MDEETQVTGIFPRYSIDVEQNSRGMTYSVKVRGDDKAQALADTREALAEVREICRAHLASESQSS